MIRPRLACAIACTLAGVACSPQPVIEARPAVWRVADGDTTVWLFGTIHALPPGVAWRTPAVERAVTDADTLVLEVAPTDGADARAEFLRVAEAPGPPILERVAAAERGVLARGMAAAGQSPASLDGLKTWAAALTIAAGAVRARDASASDGVEAVLAARFAGKAIGALETRSGQFALFDRLPATSQRTLLLEAAAGALDPARGYDATVRAWAAGDEAALAGEVARVRDPAIAAKLVTDRNARWASAIVRRMARPGRVLVAVGAGHLAGARSVVALLRARGWKVERVA